MEQQLGPCPSVGIPLLTDLIQSLRRAHECLPALASLKWSHESCTGLHVTHQTGLGQALPFSPFPCVIILSLKNQYAKYLVPSSPWLRQNISWGPLERYLL